jgi:undecaprenyl-diphosphatase
MSAKQKPSPKAPKIIEEPMVEAPKKERRLGWRIACAGGLVLVAVSTYVVVKGILFNLEVRGFHFINGWPDSLRGVFLVATIAPESLWIAVAAVVLTFLLKLYRASWELAAATVAGYATLFIAKHVVDRARPQGLLHDAIVRVHETGNGFPSGHTMIITIVSLTLLPYLPKGWRWLILILTPIMALSRVYLGVHMPLDVVGGFAVGLSIVCAMRSLPERLRHWLHFN